jgi:outer membrane murein-binding lipoprotein Lpp
MPIKRKATKKIGAARRKTTRKTKISGIASYTKKVQSSPGVKKAASTIKALEAKLKAAKKKKAAAVKAARKKLK